MKTPTSSSRPRTAVLTALVCAAAWSRLLPHLPNFTAVPAMALFSGALVGRRALAYALPLLAMLVSDLALAALVYGTKAFVMMPAVYAAIAATTSSGSSTGCAVCWTRSRRRPAAAPRRPPPACSCAVWQTRWVAFRHAAPPTRG